jgi:amino acid adenylation domain-containing protein
MTVRTSTPSTLTDAQRALLIARLRQGRASTTAMAIPPRPAALRDIPASLAQRHLWIFHQTQPDSRATYNIPFALHLEGRLNIDSLRQALGTLLDRHESLRTRLIADCDGLPSQLIDEDAPIELPVLRFENEAQWRVYADEQARLPFDLARDLMLRAQLIELADDRHVLLLVVHHVAFDGWSIGILMRELAALYGSYNNGEPPQLAELSVQPADYALWEQRRLDEHLLDEQIEYWQAALTDLPVLQLPTDRPRPLMATFAGEVEWLNLGAELTAEIQRLGREYGTTAFVVLMAALQILLHRYTGQDDIVVGTASANRARPELAGLIGYLVNILPIRTDVSGDPRFSDYLSQVHETTRNAYAHQDLPFAVIADRAGGAPDPSRAPIFGVAFSMVETPDMLRTAGLLMEYEPIDLPATKFDLDFYGRLRSGELWIELSFCTELFDRSTIRRLLGNFKVLLAGIVAAPDCRLSTLPLLTAAESRNELVTCNDTELALPKGCLHERFEQQVAQGPDRTAVLCGAESVSYAVLNAIANKIARWLRRIGIRDGSLIGVSLPPSPRRIAVILGILKAGSGYLPLDPKLPPPRLSFMVGDATTALIITDTETSARLPGVGCSLRCLDQEWPEIEQCEATDPRYRVADSNVAYAIYTSGSTGRPKGALIEHRQAVNFFESMRRLWSITPADRVLQFASLNFDASVLEIFGALLAGAGLVLSARDELLSPERLAELMRDTDVSFVCLTPTVANLLTAEPLPRLRTLVFGGEALPAELVRAWLRPGLRIINVYGPTETAMVATYAELTSCADTVPIGRPMPNCQAYVLDPALNPVPQGVVGELYIGGAGVGRGYLARPDLTGQRFIPDRFSGRAGARLYKTGDLIKRRSDGQLVFVGRTDFQVKIRGLRIELGEIETALLAHPDVTQAAAIVQRDPTGEPRLIGYVRAEDSTGTLVERLLEHLQDWLPSYMVPSQIQVLAEFPLNNSGKIDRLALPALADGTLARTYTAPRTELERTLAGSYADLLGAPRVGIDDNFFELGGNSLRAMQLVGQLGTRSNVTVGVTDVLLAPTPRLLAARIGESCGLRTTGPLVALADGDRPIYLLHPVGGTITAYLELAQRLAGRYRVIGIESYTDAGTPRDRLPELVANYFELIRQDQPNGPYRLAGWSMGGVLAYELARRLESIGEEVACLALLDAPFDLPALRHTEAASAAQFVRDVAAIQGWDLTAAPGQAVSALDQLAWLAEQAGSGDEMRAELDRRFEVFRAHQRALSGYRPSEHIRANTVLIGADSSLNRNAPVSWLKLLDGPVSTHYLAGDHYGFLRGSGVDEIARLISGQDSSTAQPIDPGSELRGAMGSRSRPM